MFAEKLFYRILLNVELEEGWEIVVWYSKYLQYNGEL